MGVVPENEKTLNPLKICLFINRTLKYRLLKEYFLTGEVFHTASGALYTIRDFKPGDTVILHSLRGKSTLTLPLELCHFP